MTPMEEDVENSKRYRGFVLTPMGLQKMQARLKILELETGIHLELLLSEFNSSSQVEFIRSL
jgi:hypothetical protein